MMNVLGEDFNAKDEKNDERSLIKMAVMSQNVNLGFEVAPEKKEKFLRDAATSKAFERVMLRAGKNIADFEKRAVKRK